MTSDTVTEPQTMPSYSSNTWSAAAAIPSTSSCRECGEGEGSGQEKRRGRSLQFSMVDALRRLRCCPYYWGCLSASDAARLLREHSAGTFLVRDSFDDRYFFTLSFCDSASKVKHARIKWFESGFCFATSQATSSSLCTRGVDTLIEHIMRDCNSAQQTRPCHVAMVHPQPDRHGDDQRINLTRPLLRTAQPSTLAHLARYAVLACVRRDHIDQLPVCRRTLEYLKDPQYLVDWRTTA